MRKSQPKGLIKSLVFNPVLIGIAVILSCSGDSSNNSGVGGAGGGGGTMREFVSPDLNGSGDSFTHVFDSAKVIPYFCKYHGGAGGIGMSGVITVNNGGSPSLHSFSIITSTLPTFDIDIGDTVTWVNNSGIVHTVESDN